ncbi:unnamed protein product [Jaminaea pallidilutea]
MARQAYLVCNPASGNLKGHALLQDKVRPLLKAADVHFIEYETQAAGDGVQVGKQLRDTFLKDSQNDGVDLLLLGGDGTTHEVLDGLYHHGLPSKAILPEVRLSIVPTGTANALYAAMYPPASSRRSCERSSDAGDSEEWQLRSLKAYLKACESSDSGSSLPSPSLFPATLSSVQLTKQDATTSNVLIHLIASHALHASILHDSEALRKEHPGIERFKMAALQNLTHWVDGELVLHGGPKDQVMQFDARTRSFVATEEKTLRGPFFYMICASTDRLEPQFVPAPFGHPQQAQAHNVQSNAATADADADVGPLARPLDQLDIVLIRPLRDPGVRQRLGLNTKDLDGRSSGMSWDGAESEKARQFFAQKRATPITEAMYNEGKHVYLRYPRVDQESAGSYEQGDAPMSADNKGEAVVEYYRCSGYDWKPHESSPRGQRTCLDGTLADAKETSCRVAQHLAGKVGVWI